MITINKSEIPKDYDYYRTGSKVFYYYYKQNPRVSLKIIGTGYKFIRIIKMFNSNFYSILAEKIDIDNINKFINDLGIKHGIIQRTPLRENKKPKGWWKMPNFLKKEFLHSTRTAFSILDSENYRNKWSSKARGHRKKILKLQGEGILKVEECKDFDLFLKIYSSLILKDPYHEWIIDWCKKSFNNKKVIKNIRIYLAKINGEVLAGALFIDEGITSEYFTSFYKEESKIYHLGIAIMDTWFSESYKKGIKYCDLDHMMDKNDSPGCKGYTKFKESIADFDVYFHDTWMKIF